MSELSLSGSIQEALRLVQRGLFNLEHYDERQEAELETVRTNLLKILQLVERDPGIEAAADDLYKGAKDFLAAKTDADASPRARQSRLLKQALARLQERAGKARPSESARLMGLG